MAIGQHVELLKG